MALHIFKSSIKSEHDVLTVMTSSNTRALHLAIMYFIRKGLKGQPLRLACMIGIMMLSLSVSAQSQQPSYSRQGNTFVQAGRTSSEGTKTKYTYTDSKGKSYEIYLCDNGRCYVNKVSAKTGKTYKYYLKEDLCKTICNEMGVKYTYVKKSNK